ncbi:Pre-rRNA-processing protein ESF2 [Fulvia fulva]|nr:Pre-rRNA-processing protein ESF2 [Fulvia fulva]
MSTRKRNEFLEGDETEEEIENGYDSEAEEGRGALGGRGNKRRKVDATSDDSDGDVENVKEPPKAGAIVKDDRFDLSNFGDEDEDDLATRGQSDDDAERSDHDREKPAKAKKDPALKKVEAAAKAVRKSGVVYISRVPPFMKPQTMKHFLEPHARKGIGRIFLTPQDPEAHKNRVKSGGNKKKSFTDGWVEFNSKTEAKIAAETLNGNIIGGKKGNFYHDDIWNMKYLKGFKWNHLTEQIANENAERAARIREDIRRQRKENKAFVEDVERAKMLDGMENKKKAKMLDGMENKKKAKGGYFVKPKLDFKQNKAKANTAKEEVKPEASAGRALRKVF